MGQRRLDVKSLHDGGMKVQFEREVTGNGFTGDVFDIVSEAYKIWEATGAATLNKTAFFQAQ